MPANSCSSAAVDRCDEVLLVEGELVEVGRSWRLRSPRRRWDELVEEGPDASVDLVADRADRVDALAGGVVELPVDVALARVDTGTRRRSPW